MVVELLHVLYTGNKIDLKSILRLKYEIVLFFENSYQGSPNL